VRPPVPPGGDEPKFVLLPTPKEDYNDYNNAHGKNERLQKIRVWTSSRSRGHRP